METIYPDPSQRYPIRMKFGINRAARIRFNLNENGVPFASTAGITWQLVLKKFPGDRVNVFSLTLGSGLRYEIYSDTILIADITAAQSNIEEAEYFLELIRTDLAQSYIKIKADFSFGKQ